MKNTVFIQLLLSLFLFSFSLSGFSQTYTGEARYYYSADKELSCEGMAELDDDGVVTFRDNKSIAGYNKKLEKIWESEKLPDEMVFVGSIFRAGETLKVFAQKGRGIYLYQYDLTGKLLSEKLAFAFLGKIKYAFKTQTIFSKDNKQYALIGTAGGGKKPLNVACLLLSVDSDEVKTYEFALTEKGWGTKPDWVIDESTLYMHSAEMLGQLRYNLITAYNFTDKTLTSIPINIPRGDFKQQIAFSYHNQKIYLAYHERMYDSKKSGNITLSLDLYIYDRTGKLLQRTALPFDTKDIQHLLRKIHVSDNGEVMVITEPIDYVSSSPNSINSNIFSRSIYYYIVGSDGTITRTGNIKKFQVQYNIGAVKATYSISHASLLNKNAVWFIYNQDRDSKEKSRLNCVRIDFAGNKSEITPLKNQPRGQFYFQIEMVNILGNALFAVGYHGGSIPTGYPEMFRIEIE